MAPNHSGRHRTTSASLPGSSDPTSCAIPCVIAGFSVSFARYRSTRSLSSSRRPTAGALPFAAAAIANVRRTVSPARPMPCASDDVIGMTPRSCSSVSAAIVAARTRSRASRTSPGSSGRSPWTATIIASCSATASRPNGSVGFVDEPMTCGTPASSSTSGTCPPPQPSTW